MSIHLSNTSTRIIIHPLLCTFAAHNNDDDSSSTNFHQLVTQSQYTRIQKTTGLPSAHVDCDVNSQVAVVSKQLGDVGVKHQTVTTVDGRLHTVMDATRRGFPCQASPVAVQLQPVTMATILEMSRLADATSNYGGQMFS